MKFIETELTLITNKLDIIEKENKDKLTDDMLHLKCGKCQFKTKHMVHLNEHLREKHRTFKCEQSLLIL